MNVAVNLAVSCEEDFLKTMVKARKAGLKVSQSFDELGIASGTIDSAKLGSLRRVPGVIVEEDRVVSAA